MTHEIETDGDPRDVTDELGDAEDIDAAPLDDIPIGDAEPEPVEDVPDVPDEEGE